MRTITNYLTEYGRHAGTIPMDRLSREQQDELIRLILSPTGDYQRYVIEHDIEHAQPDGLWKLVVAVGLLLERKRVFKDFTHRSASDLDWIVNFFAPTNLWLRLEEAFPPFDSCPRKTEYDWAEIEIFSANDAIVELDSDDPKADLSDYLSLPEVSNDFMMRLPYQTFCAEWQAGRLSAFVDRSMAVQAYRLSDSAWAYILPITFVVGLVAFIPAAVMWGAWIGGAILASAVVARKLLTKKAVDWVRMDALSNRKRFRWYSAKGIVWGRKI